MESINIVLKLTIWGADKSDSEVKYIYDKIKYWGLKEYLAKVK